MNKKFGFSALLENNNQYQFSLSQADAVIHNNKTICYKHMIHKFGKDKVFAEDSDFMVILDGVILNKKTFGKEDDWFKTIIHLYKTKGNTFFEAFRGSFGGIIYDKKENKYIIFADHIGSKFIYYTFHNGTLLCSTMIRNLYQFFQENHISYNLSTEGAYLLLSYGFMLENRTLCDKIFKINPGCYLVFQNGKLEEHRYCLLNNTPDNSLSEKDSIELLDEEFRRTVSLQFEKDKEYSYKHLVALSGGLDSRMTTWVSHDMGYVDQLNFTFSQSNYWDEKIPKQIAIDLKHEWIFKMLDNGLWLFDTNEITELTGGNVLYYGLAHGNNLLKYINFENLGIIHSGQLGDVVFGTFFLSENNKIKFHLGDGAYSKTHLNKLSHIHLKDFGNQEISNFYYRGFNGANNGMLASMLYSETWSPFMDWDLMNKVLKIPLKFRYDHNIYKKWMLSKYPASAEYTWEKMGTNIKSPTIKLKGHEVAVSQIPKKILEKFRILSKGTSSKNNMNPIGYYLSVNSDLRDYIFNILEDYEIVPDKELRLILKNIKLKGTDIEKIQAVSLIQALKLFY